MRRFAFSATVARLLVSCAQQPQQLWLKPGAAPDEFSQERYACLQQSQQPSSSAYLNRYGGVANSNIITNDGLYTACMTSKGWILTPLTDVKSYTEAMRPLGEEQRAFCSRDDLQALFKKMPCKVNDTAPEQLSDRSKISNEQKANLAKWQEYIRDINDRYAAINVQYNVKNGQAVGSSIQAGAADVDRLASELANGSIAWGEFNRRRVELNKRAQENQKNALAY